MSVIQAWLQGLSHRRYEYTHRQYEYKTLWRADFHEANNSGDLRQIDS